MQSIFCQNRVDARICCAEHDRGEDVGIFRMVRGDDRGVDDGIIRMVRGSGDRGVYKGIFRMVKGEVG